MKELLKVFFVLFFISLVTFSTISVFAEDSSNFDQLNGVNNTNSTNSTNSTNKTVTGNAIIQPMSLLVSVTVTPGNVDFGHLVAGGSEGTITNAATVQVRATNIIFGGGGELSIRSGGAFTRGTDTSNVIALNNFKYECPTVSLNKTAFTTTNSEIDQYSAPFIGTVRKTYYMNYYLTVPAGTTPGNYNTTIYYTAT